VRLSCGGAGWVSTVSVLSLCRAAARVGGAGLAGLAHTPYDTQHTKYRKINTSAGRPPPLIQFHRGSKSSRRACTALDDPTPVARMLNAHIGSATYDLTIPLPESLVVTPREGSHACVEPLEHRALLWRSAARCAQHSLPPPLMRALSLSVSLSRMLCASASARDSVSLGAQFRTHRPGRRLFIGVLAVSGYVTQKVLANKLGRGRIRHGYGVKVG